MFPCSTPRNASMLNSGPACTIVCTVTYANPDILAETDWLAAHFGDPNLRIIDCDELPAYLRIHIEGAVGLRVHHYLKSPGDSASGPGIGTHVMPAEEFAETMSRHGISNDSLVVAYDSMGGLYAARLWWALDYYGHSNCKVLNGGFRKWFEEGRAVSLDQPHVERCRFEARAVREEICATTDQLKLSIGDDDKVIWDVRAPAEYTGDDQRANKHGGHIPGAANLEWLDLTVQPPLRSGLLLPAEEIARKLAAIGVTADKQVFTHCQAGIRAAQAFFVLKLMGYPRAANYDGSWTEWGNRDDTPIVRGRG
jgi:thiosulfate/3-mercaptopyruvate sulfurtransferase